MLMIVYWFRVDDVGLLLLDGMRLPVYVETGRNVQRHECLQHNHGRVQAACSPLRGTVSDTHVHTQNTTNVLFS